MKPEPQKPMISVLFSIRTFLRVTRQICPLTFVNFPAKTFLITAWLEFLDLGMGYEVWLLIDEVSWLTFVDVYVALDRSMNLIVGFCFLASFKNLNRSLSSSGILIFFFFMKFRKCSSKVCWTFLQSPKMLWSGNWLITTRELTQPDNIHLLWLQQFLVKSSHLIGCFAVRNPAILERCSGQYALARTCNFKSTNKRTLAREKNTIKKQGRRILDILYSHSMEISTKTHLLELSTMFHVVRNQIKCILVNERPRDISRLRDLICHVYQSVNDVSVCYYIFQRRKNPARLFK